MVTEALVLLWMARLLPAPTHPSGVKAIAEAIVEVANTDPEPIDAASLLTAIAFYESRFDPHAVSDPEKDPVYSVGPWQLANPPPLPLPLDWQAGRALDLVRDSQIRCGNLTQFCSGVCQRAPKVAAVRAKLAKRLLRGSFPGVRLEPVDRIRVYNTCN